MGHATNIVEIEDDDDPVQTLDAEASPYTGNEKKMGLKKSASNLLKPQHGEARPPPPNATPILPPGHELQSHNGPIQYEVKVMTRRPPVGVASPFGPLQTSSFQPSTGRMEVPRSRRSTMVNGSGTKASWGNPPSIQDADMKGIKVPTRKLQTMSSSDIRWQDADRKFHMRLQETPGEKKRPREVISLDSVEDDHPKATVKKQRISRPGETQSPHFPRLDLVTSKPTPLMRNPLDREIAARGLSPVLRGAEPFADPFTDQGSLLESFGFGSSGLQKPIPRVPGDQTQRRHGLIQPTTSFYPEKSSEHRDAPQTEFSLGFAKIKDARDTNSYLDGEAQVQVNGERLLFRQVEPKLLSLSRVAPNEVSTVKCTPNGSKWHITTQNNEQYTMKIRDRDLAVASEALQKLFGTRIDQVQDSEFDARYLTGSALRPARIAQSTQNKTNPSVVVTNRGREVPNLGLEFIKAPTALSTKGSLELPTPKPARRRSVIRASDANDQDDQPAATKPAVPARTTRSKAATQKSIPVIEYPPDAIKNKITIYPDDLNRLNEDEFLNDAIIEFYLTYVLDHLSPETREKTHVFSTFFWTRLTKKDGAGKRGYENVKKWTAKLDLFSKKYVVIPVNESAHWYVAIICNLDQVKQKNELKPPRTRTRAKSGQVSPETLDVNEEIPEVSNAAVAVDTDMDVIPMTPPVGSRHGTPTMAVDTETSLTVPPIVVPEESAPTPPPPGEQLAQAIDVDMEITPSEEMANDFHEMSISNDPDPTYDFRNDKSIDPQQMEAINAAIDVDKRYTRRTATIRGNDTIVVDAEEPGALTSAIAQKYGNSSKAAATRRISGKPMPPDSPAIIIFDSLKLKHAPTIKALKDYLVEEAKIKRGMDISKEDIVGMHAKVPVQSNFCDCGVFLIHFVEKFLGDPDRYLPDILNRVHDAKEPEIVQDIWGGSEIRGKRKKIRELIEDLSQERIIREALEREKQMEAKREDEEQKRREMQAEFDAKREREEKEDQVRKEQARIRQEQMDAEMSLQQRDSAKALQETKELEKRKQQEKDMERWRDAKILEFPVKEQAHSRKVRPASNIYVPPPKRARDKASPTKRINTGADTRIITID